MLELTLVRHGETSYNAERRMQGHLDIPLNEQGLWQAKRLAESLKGQKFDRVYSSDLARAHVTAKTSFPDSKIILDKRLRERCYGEFEGKTAVDYSPDEAKIYRAYKKDPFKNRLTGGENSYELFDRISQWLSSLPKRGKIIAFTHGGVVRSMIRQIEGEKADIGPIENTSLNLFRFEKSVWSIVYLNDCRHIYDWDEANSG